MKNSPPPTPNPEPRTLVDELLAEQRSLTAVERFSRAHEELDAPTQAKYYRDLIPLTAPKPGQQYGFEVDLDKCSGCKACVTACHALNGLDEEETWRDVGLLHSEDWRAPFQATVTTACHHCVDPGCLSGCPVLAYDKDPVTGIVRHLDDQCIGCQYCVMKCPYEVPQYSKPRGIVRKCDMCSNRLSQGEAPACVQACPSQAIRITLVDQREVSIQFREGAEAQNLFLPTSPAPNLTIPTTRYKSAKPLPAGLIAGDSGRVAPATAHVPLVLMLVLTQLAAGAAVASVFFNKGKMLAIAAAIFGALGLGLGTQHLGQPLKAWRAFLGWRTSWFSREVIAFGLFVPLTIVGALSFFVPGLHGFTQTVMTIAAIAGVVSVACSAMVYVDTHREFWRASQSFGKFFGTTILLGAAAALAVSASDSIRAALLAGTVFLASLIKLGFEHRIFNHLLDQDAPALTPLSRTARLLDGELGHLARRRIGCGVVGGMILPLLLALGAAPSGAATTLLAFAMFALCVAGEMLERHLFFKAVAPAKMPGGLVA